MDSMRDHDDAEREYTYDRESHIGKLDKGLDAAAEAGWMLVSMKNDWSRLFPAGEAAKPCRVRSIPTP